MSADPPSDSSAVDRPSAVDSPDPTACDRRQLLDRAPSLARDVVAVPGLIATVAGLALAGGVGGLLLAPVVVGLWAVAAPMYAATAALLLLGVLIAGDPTAAAATNPASAGAGTLVGGASGLTVALLGGGAAWLVLAPAFRGSRTGHVVGATFVAGVATVAVAVATLQRASAGVAAIALCLVVALGCYALHRYSLVRLAYRDPS